MSPPERFIIVIYSVFLVSAIRLACLLLSPACLASYMTWLTPILCAEHPLLVLNTILSGLQIAKDVYKIKFVSFCWTLLCYYDMLSIARIPVEFEVSTIVKVIC